MNTSKEKESGLYKQSHHAKRAKDEKLDQALADTFPASDPIPWTSDVDKAASERNAEPDARDESQRRAKQKENRKRRN